MPILSKELQDFLAGIGGQAPEDDIISKLMQGVNPTPGQPPPQSNLTDRQVGRGAGTVPTGVGDLLLDKIANPLLNKLGDKGQAVSGGLNKFADFAGDLSGSLRASAERGGLGAIAPNFSAGVQGAAQAEVDNALKRAQMGYTNAQVGAANATAAAASNPINNLPDSVFKNYDPQSVISAVQSQDITKLVPLGADTTDVTRTLNDLGDDIRAESRDYEDIRSAYGKITAFANDPSPAGDLGLIFNFMKMLDPGSTVREGEFANAQNSGGVPTRVTAMYNQILNGERLTEGQRTDFLGQAGRAYNSEAKIQEERNSRFRSRAKNANVPDLLIDPILPPVQFQDIPEYALPQDPGQPGPSTPVDESRMEDLETEAARLRREIAEAEGK